MTLEEVEAVVIYNECNDRSSSKACVTVTGCRRSTDDRRRRGCDQRYHRTHGSHTMRGDWSSAPTDHLVQRQVTNNTILSRGLSFVHRAMFILRAHNSRAERCVCCRRLLRDCTAHRQVMSHSPLDCRHVIDDMLLKTTLRLVERFLV